MTRVSRSISVMLCLFSCIGNLKAQDLQVPLSNGSSTASALPIYAIATREIKVNVRRVVVDIVVT
jgi:hypothetical protein